MKHIKLFESWMNDEASGILDLSEFAIDTSGKNESVFVAEIDSSFYIYLGDKETCKELDRLAGPHFHTDYWSHSEISFVGISDDDTIWVAGKAIDDPAKENYNLVVIGRDGSESFNDEALKVAYLTPIVRGSIIKIDEEHAPSDMSLDEFIDIVNNFDSERRRSMKDFLDRNPDIPRGSY